MEATTKWRLKWKFEMRQKPGLQRDIQGNGQENGNYYDCVFGSINYRGYYKNPFIARRRYETVLEGLLGLLGPYHRNI